MKQKVISLALILVMALSISASAAGVAPLWDKADRCDAKLTFNGSTAVCTVTMEGTSQVAGCFISMTLEKRNADGSYSPVQSWPVRMYMGTDATRVETVANCTAGTYLLTATVDVHDAHSGVENIVVTATARR